MEVETTNQAAPVAVPTEESSESVKENPYIPEYLKPALEALPKQEVTAEPAPVIDTTDAEKLQAARIEVSFLKTQQEIERQKQLAQNLQRGFPQFVENLAKKYHVDMQSYFFDAAEGNFKRKK
jgi:hypothetical protein